MTTTHFQLEDQKLFDGETYVASADADLANGGTLSLLFENPSSNTIEAYIYHGDMSQESESKVEVFDEVSGISGGSNATVNNNTVGSDNSTDLTVTQDATFTGDNVHHASTYVGSGEFGLFDGYKILLPSGEKMAVLITNESGGDSETSVKVAWAEKPE